MGVLQGLYEGSVGAPVGFYGGSFGDTTTGSTSA